jgi:hypothetical protein
MEKSQFGAQGRKAGTALDTTMLFLNIFTAVRCEIEHVMQELRAEIKVNGVEPQFERRLLSVPFTVTVRLVSEDKGTVQTLTTSFNVLRSYPANSQCLFRPSGFRDFDLGVVNWLRELSLVGAVGEQTVRTGVFENGFAIVSVTPEFRLVPLSPTVSQGLASSGRRGVGEITVTFSIPETEKRH